jgi:uncharacterized protein YgiM (DUF1202 family)
LIIDLKIRLRQPVRWLLLLGLVVGYGLMLSPYVFAQTATPTPTLTAPPTCQTYHLIGDIGRVYSCAGENCGTVIGGFNRTETICVLGIAEDDPAWREVQLGEDDTSEERTTGFMRADQIEPGPPGTSADPASYCDAWEVTITQANVRSCPESNCGSVGSLQQGTRVCATGYSGSFTEWQEVEYQPGVIGYVDATLMRYVSIDEFPCETYAPTTEVTVYSCAGIGCASVATLAADQTVCSPGTVSEDLEWIRIDFGQPGESGWVLTRALQIVPEEALLTVTPTNTTTPEARVIAQAAINVRASADANAEIVAILPANTNARVLAVGDNGWYQIELTGGQIGWVSPTSVQVLGDLSGVSNAAVVTTSTPAETGSISVAQASSPTSSRTPSRTPTATTRAVTVTPQGATAAASLTPTNTPEPATDTPVVPTTAPTSASTALPACTYYQVNSDAINVRSAPTTQSDVVATLQRNTPVCVRGEAQSQDTNPWFLVDLNPNGTTPTLGYIAQFLVVPFQGPTPTLVNSPVPTATLDTAGALPSTATPVESGTPVICPTDIPAATPQPGETPATATNQPGLPAIVGCITATPTPFLTAQPTQFASDVVLARDIPLNALNIRQNIVLESPQGLSQFRLRIPDDWEPTGNNVLYLNIEYFEDSTAAIGADFAPPITTLDIRLNDQLIASVSLTAADVGERTLEIPLPTNILANPLRRSHTVSISLDARDACRVRVQSRVLVRVDRSFVHYEYREYLPTLDLARYPRPLFNNRRIVNEFESAWIVLPPDASSSDYQAAASVSAGLGFLTNSDLQVRVVTTDTLTQPDREANHLLLIGTPRTNPMIADLYARSLLPTTLDGSSLRFRDTQIDAEHGVVQVIQHPENPRRAIFVVTGETDIAVAKAAQALAGRPSVLGLGGTLAIISDTQPLFHPVTNTIFDQPLTFADLGVTEDIQLNGLGTQFTEIEFNVPAGGVVAPDAYVDIIYNYSQILAVTNASFTVSMNNIPIGSTPLTQLGAAGPTPTQLPADYHLRVSVPVNSVIPGAVNALSLQLDVPLSYGCEPPNPEASWFTVSRQSVLYLPRTTFSFTTFAPVVGLFPVPMNSLPNLQDVWISLPENPTPQELEQGMQMVALLASQTSLGEGFIPRVSLGAIPEGTDLSQYHFIVIGRHTTNPFLASLNPNLPQPFLEGTDQIQQTLDDTIYILPEGFDIGILQMLVSPWASNRLILVITGVSPVGQNYAANVLLSRNYDRSQLQGDIVFAAANDINTIDSRSVERIEILEAVPDVATFSAQLPTATDLPVVTVTAGPTLTPLPSNTPGPTAPPTAIFTFTPVPTQNTPIPTFPPRAEEEYQPIETEIPNSVLGLMGVTGGVVVLVLLYGLFLWIRARRRAAKR